MHFVFHRHPTASKLAVSSNSKYWRLKSIFHAMLRYLGIIFFEKENIWRRHVYTRRTDFANNCCVGSLALYSITNLCFTYIGLIEDNRIFV